MDNTLSMLPTSHCLSGEQEWLAQVETSKLQESKLKMPPMTGNLLGSRTASLGVQSPWFGILSVRNPSAGRQKGFGLKTMQGAQIVLLHVREKTCESGCVFVHVPVGVKDTEIPRERRGAVRSRKR